MLRPLDGVLSIEHRQPILDTTNGENRQTYTMPLCRQYGQILGRLAFPQRCSYVTE